MSADPRAKSAAILGTIAIILGIVASATDLAQKLSSLFGGVSAKSREVALADSLGRQSLVYGHRTHKWLMAVKDTLERNPELYETIVFTNSCGIDVRAAMFYKLPGARPVVREGWFLVDSGYNYRLRVFPTGTEAAVYIRPDQSSFHWVPNSTKINGPFPVLDDIFADDGSELLQGTGTENLVFEQIRFGKLMGDTTTYEIHCSHDSA